MAGWRVRLKSVAQAVKTPAAVATTNTSQWISR